ncbi:hypothetical protein [Bradyrhizobium sp. JR18.2]|uniref:hypothetical protein n=1 Tax=Bradyrhizobium sp. JR18.2 TaxID=3156369 RepID=UPI00339AB5E4
MAARTRKVKHDDFTRERIKTTQLVNRLENHVFGKIELQPSQVTAALGLLKKSLPDLSAVEAKHDVSDALSDLLKAVDGRTRGIPTGG